MLANEFSETYKKYQRAILDRDTELADKLYLKLHELAASGKYYASETEPVMSAISHSRQISAQGDFNAEAVAKLREYMSPERAAERKQKRAEERSKMRRDQQRRISQRVAGRQGKRVLGSIVAPETNDSRFSAVIAAQLVDTFGEGALDVVDGIVESIAAGGSDSLWVAKKEFTPYLDSNFEELQALGRDIANTYGLGKSDEIAAAIEKHF